MNVDTNTYPCNHTPPKCFPHPENSILPLASQITLCLQRQPPPECFPHPLILPVLETKIKENQRECIHLAVYFCSNMEFRLLCAPQFLGLIAECCANIRTQSYLFIQSSFSVLAVMNICIQLVLWPYVFILGGK